MDRKTTGALIRDARRARKLTQEALARRAGVSLAGVKAYEQGARHPSPPALRAICEALGLPGEQAGDLFAAAGFVGAAPRRELTPGTIDDLRREAAGCLWPAFVTNQAMDILVPNLAFERAFGVDLTSEFTGFGQRNFLAGMTDERFASRLENWDEVARFLIGLAKGDPRFRVDDDRPLPWFETAVARALTGEPARTTRLLTIWDEAPPIMPMLRYRCPIRWREPRGALLAFAGVTMLEDATTELHWNEWLPADVPTWQWCITGEQL